MPASAVLSSIHREHVHGAASGRFALLRALSARVQRGALALAAARLRMCAAQAGLGAGAASQVPEDEAAVEAMSAAELEALLATEELCVLAAHVDGADDVE